MTRVAILALLCPVAALADASFTSCSTTVTTTCLPGPVTSSATIELMPSTTTPPDPPPTGNGFDTVPASCLNVASLWTWQKTTRTSWLPNLPASTVDATDYRNVFSPPGTGQQPWPSASSGSKPVVSIAAQAFLALGFTVPAASTFGPRYFNVNSISQPVSITVSECPGDFGQKGTHIANAYCKSNRTGGSNGGVQTWPSGVLGTCPVLPGHTYWLNLLDSDLPSSGGTTPPASACLSVSCTAQLQLTY